jgi:hypothetical protein
MPINQNQSIKMGHGGYRPGAGSGGKRPGAGRRKGSRGKRVLATIAVMKQIQASLGPNAEPLALVLAVMRHEGLDMRIRLKAAITAAPYFHKKLPRQREPMPLTTAAPAVMTVTISRQPVIAPPTETVAPKTSRPRLKKNQSISRSRRGDDRKANGRLRLIKPPMSRLPSWFKMYESDKIGAGRLGSRDETQGP